MADLTFQERCAGAPDARFFVTRAIRSVPERLSFEQTHAEASVFSYSSASVGSFFAWDTTRVFSRSQMGDEGLVESGNAPAEHGRVKSGRKHQVRIAGKRRPQHGLEDLNWGLFP